MPMLFKKKNLFIETNYILVVTGNSEKVIT